MVIRLDDNTEEPNKPWWLEEHYWTPEGTAKLVDILDNNGVHEYGAPLHGGTEYSNSDVSKRLTGMDGHILVRIYAEILRRYETATVERNFGKMIRMKQLLTDIKYHLKGLGSSDLIGYIDDAGHEWMTDLEGFDGGCDIEASIRQSYERVLKELAGIILIRQCEFPGRDPNLIGEVPTSC